MEEVGGFLREVSDEILDRWLAASNDAHLFGPHIVNSLCVALKNERAEREKNPGVWDGAPEWADEARPFWLCTTIGKSDGKTEYGPIIRRTLPKTKAREIAERKAGELNGLLCTKSDVISAIESAINEAMGGEK